MRGSIEGGYSPFQTAEKHESNSVFKQFPGELKSAIVNEILQHREFPVIRTIRIKQ